MTILNHDLDKDRLIQRCRQVHDETAEDEGRDHQDRLLHERTKGLLFMLHIRVHTIHEHAAVLHIDEYHEDQCHENAAAGSQCASHRASDRLDRLALSHYSLHQKISRQNTDHRIRDLLQDL